MSGWSVEFISEDARAEFNVFSVDARASLNRIIQLIVVYGLPQLTMPHVRRLKGKVWEMRGKGRDGIVRSMYITVTGRKVVILRSFMKKTQKTPDNEIEIALKRAREAGYEP